MNKKIILFVCSFVLCGSVQGEAVSYGPLPIETGIGAVGALAELGQLWREWRTRGEIAGLRKEQESLLQERKDLDEALAVDGLSAFHRQSLEAQRDALNERFEPSLMKIEEKESAARKKTQWWGKIAHSLYALDAGINPYNKTEKTKYVAPVSGVAGHLLTAKAQQHTSVGKNLFLRLLLLIARVLTHVGRSQSWFDGPTEGERLKRVLPLIDLARTWLSTSGSTARKTRTAALLAHLAQAGSSLYEGPVQQVSSRNFDDNGYMTGYTVPANLADADKVVTHLGTKYQELRGEVKRRWEHPTALLMHKQVQEEITTKESSLMTELASLVAPAPLTAAESPQAFIARVNDFMKIVEAGRQFAQRPDAVKQAITNLGDVTAEQLRATCLPVVYNRYLDNLATRLDEAKRGAPDVGSLLSRMEELTRVNKYCSSCGRDPLAVTNLLYDPPILSRIQKARNFIASNSHFSPTEKSLLTSQQAALDQFVVEVNAYRAEQLNCKEVASVYFRLRHMEELEAAFRARMQEVVDWEPKTSYCPNYLVTFGAGNYTALPFCTKHCCGWEAVIDHLRVVRADMESRLATLSRNPAIARAVIDDLRGKVSRYADDGYMAAFGVDSEAAKKEVARKFGEKQREAAAKTNKEHSEQKAWAANGGFNPGVFSGMGPGGTGGYASAPAAAPGGYGLPPRQSYDAPPPPPMPAPVPAGNIVHLLQKALEIAEGADYAATREAYHQFARENHPDKVDRARGQFLSDALFEAAKKKATEHFQAVSDVWGIAGENDAVFAAALRDGFVAGTSKGVESVLKGMAQASARK